ncbi:MFS transporter [Kushneria aurantia]|uniref:MFS transporter n=1 Tax=Kushneria aurantia TaxID=504092 RepID=A0ABV6G0M9_9GAMM|nr:MFS transporter [Kushneria aurantia]
MIGRLILLALGAFVAQSSEYLPISVMSAARDDLGVSESAIGSLVTGYAWIAALSAVPLTMLTVQWDRRTLFLILLATIAVAGGLGALAPNYGLLAASRVLMALAHGVFWTILAVFAVRLSPDVPKTRVLAIVFAGISLAGIAGIPLSTTVAQAIGWRWAFAGLALLAGILCLMGMVVLPKVPPGSADAPPAPSFRNRRLCRVVVATAIIVSRHFCAYTYIVPLLEQTTGIRVAIMPGLLLVFGVAGAFALSLSGWLGLSAISLALIATTGLAVGQILFGFGDGFVPIALALSIWGGASAVLVAGLQGTAIDSAPGQADMASALYVSAFNVGIGSGAVIGGLLTIVAPMAILPWTGAALASAGLWLLLNNREHRT